MHGGPENSSKVHILIKYIIRKMPKKHNLSFANMETLSKMFEILEKNEKGLDDHWPGP